MNVIQYVNKRSRELGFFAFDVRGPNRRVSLVRARQIIAAELRAAPWSMSLPEIARAIGRRDHTSALWWLRGGKHK